MNEQQIQELLGSDGRGKHNRSLTDDQVREIRKLYQLGESQTSLAEKYGLGQQSVSQIITGFSYKHIELYPREKIEIPDGMKQCPRCEEIQPKTEFTKNRAKPDGLKVYCKTCCKKEREEKRDYYNQKSKEWREANPDRFKEKRDAWMQAHPQSESETRQKWLEENKIKVREIKTRYKARRITWEVGEVDYLEILMRDNFHCHICGNYIDDPTDIHFDHVVPLAKGGAHSNDNIHVAHSKCNMRKGTKSLEEARMIEVVTATVKSG